MIILASDLMMSILNDRTKNERQLITRFGPIFFYFNAFQYFAVTANSETKCINVYSADS